jgi:flagellar biogenesis protein FliO
MENISYIGSLFKMLLALAAVLAMMIGTVYLLKNLMGRTKPGTDDGELIKILAVKSLGPRSSIMVLETLGKVTVVGIAGGQMNLLTTVDDQEALGRLREMRRPLPNTSSGLAMDTIRDKMMKAFKRK